MFPYFYSFHWWSEGVGKWLSLAWEFWGFFCIYVGLWIPNAGAISMTTSFYFDFLFLLCRLEISWFVFVIWTLQEGRLRFWSDFSVSESHVYKENATEQLAMLFSILQMQNLDKRKHCSFEFSPLGRDFTLADDFMWEALHSSVINSWQLYCNCTE